VGVTRIFAVFGAQWMRVLQCDITYQEVMTLIEIGDGNSRPEQDRVRADEEPMPRSLKAEAAAPDPS